MLKSSMDHRLPYARAFVVQFTADSDVSLERVEGRVEHMQSGRRARFASTEELLASLAHFLADEPADTGCRRTGES
jgi:hypothetical protein